MDAKLQYVDKVFVCRTVAAMINRLQNLHRSKFLHGRLGLDSFSFGIKDPHILYLTNFYHSKRVANNHLMETNELLNITFASSN